MPAGTFKAIIAGLTVAFGMHGDRPPRADRLGLPPLMLWSWDRTEDLGFIDPADTGVAYLAATIHIAADGLTVVPRHNPLVLPAGIATIAVVHVELDRARPPLPNDAAPDRLAEAIAQVAPTASRLQVDFEVAQSQRPLFTGTIDALGHDLPHTPISVTALSSWCLNESWIEALPVDEIVPMVFRLGPDRTRIVGHLTAGGDFRDARCRGSIGVATDEWPDAALPRDDRGTRRIYVFTPKRWTAEGYAAVRRKLGL